ncbi:MAG: hypothetical protein WD208_06715 [Dehalococcoidia bacterium]
MDNRLRRYIVHGASERMSGGAIADDLDVGRSTVYDFLKKLDEAADNFARYGIVVEVFTERSGRGSEWFCRICGSTWRKRIPAGVHASMHLFEPHAEYELRLVRRMLAQDEEQGQIL